MKRSYECMFILKEDMPKQEKEDIFRRIAETITKHHGVVAQAEVWAEKKKFCYPIKKQKEGLYYLVRFALDSSELEKVKASYRIQEEILRFLVVKED